VHPVLLKICEGDESTVDVIRIYIVQDMNSFIVSAFSIFLLNYLGN
jgi:hypothetical protein